MSAVEYLAQKIEDPRTDDRQMRDYTISLIDQCERLRDQYVKLDKEMGVAFTRHASEGAQKAREELDAAVGVEAKREIARRVLNLANDVQMLLMNYY